MQTATEYAIIVIGAPLAVPGMWTRTATGYATIAAWAGTIANRAGARGAWIWTATGSAIIGALAGARGMWIWTATGFAITGRPAVMAAAMGRAAEAKKRGAVCGASRR